jgi:hypothetical protein
MAGVVPGSASTQRPKSAAAGWDGEETRPLLIVAFRSVETNTQLFQCRKPQTTTCPLSTRKRS